MTVTSGNLTLVPLANIVLAGTGANRTISITPAANQTGSAVITVAYPTANCPGTGWRCGLVTEWG